MKFLSDILAKAGLTVDGVVTLNNTATGQTPDANDNSTKLATTAWVRTFVQPYSLPIASASTLGGIKVGAGLSINPSTGVLSASAAGISTRDIYTFTATAGQTTFSCFYTVDQVDVFYNGSKLGASEFTATNGTSVVLNTACKVGDYLEIVSWVAGAGLSSSRTLTIDGVTYDLTANRTWNILPTGGAAGDILAKSSATNYDVAWIPNYTSTVQHTVKAAVAVTKGQAVYVSSADGTNMIVSKASNASEQTSSKTLGLVAQDLAINGQGFVVTEGLLAGLNTSTANAGDPVWLGTDGNLIFGLLNKPTAPVHLVFIGIVTRVQTNNGEIFVKVQNGFELDELHDLSVKNASDGDMIKYVASTGLWTKIAATTTNITEGTNLYYTQARFDTAFAAKSTSNLTEGTNLYYTTARANSDFDTRLATKSTTNLAEGTNLYYTDTRVGTYLTANSYATQSYVSTQIANLVDSAPTTLDTLNELAAALGDDPNFATTVSTSIGTKVPQTRTITINGTAYDLSADRSWSIAAGVTAFNTRTGAITLTSGDVTGALGYTPYNATNPSGYITGITSSNVTTALGYTPYNSTNPSGYISSYTETDTLASVTGRGATTSTPITVTASEGREVSVYMPSSYTTNDLVSGHEYGWYDDHWRLGMTRSASAPGADFVVQWNTARKLSLTNSGNLTVTGTISASNLSGTNTGDQTNISGNAATATSAGYLTGGSSSAYMLLYSALSGDLNTYNSPGLYSAEYTGSTNRPISQNGSFIQISDAGGTDVKTQWYYSSDGANIYMRLMWGDATWRAWRTLITDANISSQSVSYASSAGSVAWTNVSGRPTALSSFTNDSGYIISSGAVNSTYRAIVEDTRSAERSPNDYDDYRVSWEFTNQIVSGWHTVMTMQGWHNGYAAWQIIGPSDSAHENWYLRSGNNTSWNSLRSIWHSGNFAPGNYLALSGGTVTGDVIFGNNSVSDQGIRINYGNYTSGYGRIRFLQDGSNHSTIHSFSSSWQSGSVAGHSTGCINIDGGNGVTFGGWNNPDGYITRLGVSSFKDLNASVKLSYTTNVTGNIGGSGSYGGSHKWNLFLGYDAGADETWLRVYVQQGYAINANDVQIKIRVVWNPQHASFAAYQELEVMAHTTYWRPPSYCQFSGVKKTKCSDFGGGSYYGASSTPNVDLYDNNDGYLYIRVKGRHDGQNLKRTVEVEMLGQINGTPVLETCSAPSSGNFIGETYQLDFQTGNLYVSGDVTAYYSSDKRLKDNIVNIDNPISKIMKLNGVTFNWNDRQVVYELGSKDYGVIAQDIEEVMPELVKDRDTGYKGVRYEKIIPLLIEGIKELKTENDALKEILKRNNII